ncbi:E3 ubiquitin-protein ligase RNF14-like [Pungitius pungitius]|uniref:E3 ubiquitin-protein ligase RNF14-like n=1 Tax=Pungitius pungitius TaxID=134920 RepID=UPI002E0E609C
MDAELVLTAAVDADTQEQEDELLALNSIFGSEEFVRDESRSAGEIRVCAELPADFTVVLKEGESLRQYQLSFLPPLLLTFELPEDYPSSSAPSFSLTCSWLTDTQLSALAAQLTDLYLATGGAVVLFSWVQFLKEDTLRFLDIYSVLELPSDEPLYDSPDLNAPLSEAAAPSQAPSTSDWGGADSMEAERTLRTSGNNHPSTVAGVSKHLQYAPSDRSDRGEVSNDGGAAAWSIHSRESPQNGNPASLTPSQTLLSQLLIWNAARTHNAFSATVFDCGVCFVGFLGSDCIQLPECGHVFCKACLTKFCQLQITEGNVKGVTCPEADCSATPAPSQVRCLVGEELFSRYDRLLLQSTLDSMADVVYCPRRFCGLAVIFERSSAAAQCSVCGFAFCVTCRKNFHGTEGCPKKSITKIQEAEADLPQSQEGLMGLWEDYASGSKKRQRLLERRYGRAVMQGTVGECLSEDWISSNSKNCPHCFWKIEKNGGCNMMMCTQCGQRFCWVCLTRLPTSRPGKHFDGSACSQYQ